LVLVSSLPLRLVVCCLVGPVLLVATSDACAESSVALRAASLDEEGGIPAPAPGPSAISQTRPAITAEQLNAFAELTGDPRPVVWQRLKLDPGMVPFAVAAANARMDRRASGKIRAAVGFTIFGVGGIAGCLIALSGLGVTCDNWDNSACASQVWRRLVIGLVVIAASAGVGLPIGIPGIASMLRSSEAERIATDRYQKPQIPMPSPGSSPGHSGLPSVRTFRVPLLSLSF
jgi:hypothetical protein